VLPGVTPRLTPRPLACAALGAVAGPVGGIFAAAATAALGDLLKRLTHREAERIATVTELASGLIRQRVAEGAQPRAEDLAELRAILG